MFRHHLGIILGDHYIEYILHIQHIVYYTIYLLYYAYSGIWAVNRGFCGVIGGIVVEWDKDGFNVQPAPNAIHFEAARNECRLVSARPPPLPLPVSRSACRRRIRPTCLRPASMAWDDSNFKLLGLFNLCWIDHLAVQFFLCTYKYRFVSVWESIAESKEVACVPHLLQSKACQSHSSTSDPSIDACIYAYMHKSFHLSKTWVYLATGACLCKVPYMGAKSALKALQWHSWITNKLQNRCTSPVAAGGCILLLLHSVQ